MHSRPRRASLGLASRGRPAHLVIACVRGRLSLHARRGEVAVAHVVRVVDAQVGRLEHHGAAEQRGVARRSRPRAEPAQKVEAPFSKCKSRGCKPPTVCDSAQSACVCGVAWRRGRASAWTLAATPAATPASTPAPPPLGPLRRATPRPARPQARPAGLGTGPGIKCSPPPAAAREGDRPFRRARVLARPPPPRSSADGRPSRPTTPAPVRADRVRHAAGAARRTARCSPTAHAARAREPANAAADAHAAGGPAAAAAVVHQSSVARGVPTQPIILSCLACLPNSCRRQTASQ